jgi:O-antigen/teichoic acid export membrane protein
MPILSAILPKLPKKLSNQFVRNLRWLGLAEIISRIFRLGLTVILARFLTPYDYSLAAIVSTVNEFMRIFMKIGVNAKIIQCDRQELDTICNSGYWLNWSIFTSLFIAQCLGIHWQAIGVATAVLLAHTLFIPLFTIWTTRHVLHRS